MVRIRLIFLFSFAYSSIYSQQFASDSVQSVVHTLKSESGVLISAKNRLPFWLTANNSQRFTERSANSSYQILHYNANYQPTKNIALKWELESLLNIRERINGRIIQANVSLESKLITIRGGYDEEFFGLNDSTLSIGNLVYGNNARPIPKISISTNGWQRSPFFGNHLSFQAYLAHGWFEQNRFQSGAFLHQKYFYFRFKAFKNRLSIIGGLNHNAQWGGSNSQSEVSQPKGIKNYLRIFMGTSGGNDADLIDRNNALGNHLGSSDMSIQYKFNKFSVRGYWQFLWDDKSGLVPFNWRDGMTGVSVELFESKLLNRVTFELIRTGDQNGNKTSKDGISFFEPDNFFNNGLYKTGWSYHNQVIGTPLFLILNDQSTSLSRIKNNVTAFNIGFSGRIKNLDYQINFVNLENKGTKREVISPSLKLKSVDILLGYGISKGSQLGSQISFQEASFGSLRNMGIQFFYKKNLTF